MSAGPTQVSSYLDYLPRVIGSSETDPSRFLGRMLCVFEKILTGIQDGLPIRHGAHEHEPLEVTLDNLHQLFDPWRTRPELLPWLASWLALTLESGWTEYQRRKLMSDIVPAYQQRGLKEGLYRHLDVYVASQARPRIMIDDGEAVLRGELGPDGTFQLRGVGYSNTVTGPGAATTILLHPSAIAVDAANNYIVADQGDLSLTVPRPPALWRVSSAGEVEYQAPAAARPMPRPILAGSPLATPTGIVVDAQGRYAILDVGDLRTITSSTSLVSGIYRLVPPSPTAPSPTPTTVISQSTTPTFPAVRPVDMVLDADRALRCLGPWWASARQSAGRSRGATDRDRQRGAVGGKHPGPGHHPGADRARDGRTGTLHRGRREGSVHREPGGSRAGRPNGWLDPDLAAG